MFGYKCSAILATAWLASFCLRGRSAAVRHLVWTVAFAAVLVLPLLSIGLPALPLPMGSFWQPGDVTFQATVLMSPADAASAQVPKPPAPTLLTSWHPNWRFIMLLVWALGSVCSLAQMLLAGITMFRLRRRLASFFQPGFEQLAQNFGIKHRVDLLANQPGSMPMALGLLRPAVLLPTEAVQWTDERRRVVLLHELAHIRRGDTVTHLLARTALGIYWWNPFAWIAWFECLKERERAADDRVLAAGTRATDYAAHLLDIARCSQLFPSSAWAAVAMARPSQLETRLSAILDSSLNRAVPGKAVLAAAVLAAIVIVGPIAALRAQSPDLEATIRAAEGQKNPQMLEDAAQAAVTLHKYDIAQTLLESALSLRAVTPESGHTLMLLGDLKRAQGHTADAMNYYSKAAAVLGNRPETAQALIQLGVGKIIGENLAGALEDFELARNLDPAHAGPALMWMAVVHQRQGEMDQADSLYRASLAMEASPTTAHLLALLLSNQGREGEAQQLQQQAASAHVLSASEPGAYRIGRGVSAPSVASKVEPEYTDEARAAMLSGTSILSVVIGPEGIARQISVIRPVGLGLDEKAIDAIRQWRFMPGTKDGQPVSVYATIEVNFRLL